jgi:hypothetical protein
MISTDPAVARRSEEMVLARLPEILYHRLFIC